MRIIGGKYRGRRIVAPPELRVRPTADRVREALFNRLDNAGWGEAGGSVVRGARVLDAFAGSGALGIEALSRGAAHVTFIDRDKAVAAAIRQNLRRLDGDAAATIVCADVLEPPPAAGPCDLILMDPPYRDELAAPALVALKARGWIASAALIVVETSRREEPCPPAGCSLIDTRRYGAAQLVFMRSD